MRDITFQDVLQTTTNQQFLLGEVGKTPDGRVFRYVKANEALSLGHVAVPVATTDVDTVSSSTNAAGQIVYITEASAGWTVGAYEDGWVHVNDGTGEGQVAKIKTNTTDTLILYPEFALSTALAVADSDIIITRPFLAEKAAITDKTQNAIGGAQVAFAANDYGWVLAKGRGVVIAGEALTVGQSCVTGDDTEGEVVKGTTAKGDFDEQTIGIVVSANTAADKGALIDYTIIK